MNKMFSVLAMAVLLSTVMIVPVQAHEDAHDDGDDVVQNSCEVQLNIMSDMFVQFGLWNYTDMEILRHTDPEHNLFHSGQYEGNFRGLEVFASPFPPESDISLNTGDGCHPLIPVGWCRRCVKWEDSDRDDHEPVCVKYKVWACVYHLPHCDS